MPAVSNVILALGVAVSAGGAAANYASQSSAAKKSEELQNESLALQQQQQQVQEMRNRRAAYREVLKAQALSESNAGAQGGSASSALQGGLAQAANSGIQTQQNIGINSQFQNQANRINAESNINAGKVGAGGFISAAGNLLTSVSQTKTVQGMGRLI